MENKYNIESYNQKEPSKQDAYYKAKKRIDELKGFYWHLFWYVAVNIFINFGSIYGNMENGKAFNEAFIENNTLGLWFFWGIGVFFHFINVFGKNLFLGKKWEERKVQENLDKEERQNWN